MNNKPAGIALITVWLFLNGLFTLGAAAAPLFVLDLLGFAGLSGAVPIIAALVTLAIAIAYFALGWGLWALRDWARLATIVLSAIGLVFGLVAAVVFLFGIEIGGVRLGFSGLGLGFLIGVTLNGLIIWYLLKPDIQDLFTGRAAAMGGGYGEAPWQESGAGLSIGFGGGSTATGMPPDWGRTGSGGGGFSAPTPTSIPVHATGPSAPVIDPTRPLHEPEPVAGWLVVRSGPRANEQVKLRAGSNVVGRDGRKSQVLVDDPSVSSEHAKIRWENGVFVIYDLASTNGTFVNNRRIEKQRLMDGDSVRLGRMEFVFKQLDPRHQQAR